MATQAIDQFKVNGKTVSIYQDTDADSPRTWDHMSTFAGYHRHYIVGEHKSGDLKLRDRPTLRQLVEREGRGAIVAAIEFSMAHTGTVGYAYVTRASAIRMGCLPGSEFKDHEGNVRRYDRAYFVSYIEGEIEIYERWAAGEVYGYVVEGRNGDEIDSCWGFYGMSDVTEQARSAAEDCDDPADDEEADALAARATFAGHLP